MSDKPIAVIGAGIVGISCALWLSLRGHRVILIDRNEPGSGTSSGNACTFADYACIPVNNPTLITQLPSLMFSANSPLRVDWHFALTQMPWLLSFLRHCQKDRVAHSVAALAKLTNRTYEGWSPLIEAAGASDLMTQNGCLYVYQTASAFKGARASNMKRQSHGVIFNELSESDIRNMEPGLDTSFHAGLHFHSASHTVNPQSLASTLFKTFKVNQSFVKQSVNHIQSNGDDFVLHTDNEAIDASLVVLATGAFGKRIKGAMLEKVPLGTERGYHVQYTAEQQRLTQPVGWAEAGLYATPMNEGLRFAGTVEIASLDKTPNPRNLAYLQRKAKQMTGIDRKPEQSWLGFRPTLPDALPVIGESSRLPGLYYAFGHQHIGLTLAGITGKLIAGMINREPAEFDLADYSPKRFNA